MLIKIWTIPGSIAGCPNTKVSELSTRLGRSYSEGSIVVNLPQPKTNYKKLYYLQDFKSITKVPYEKNPTLSIETLVL